MCQVDEALLGQGSLGRHGAGLSNGRAAMSDRLSSESPEQPPVRLPVRSRGIAQHGVCSRAKAVMMPGAGRCAGGLCGAAGSDSATDGGEWSPGTSIPSLTLVSYISVLKP